MTRTTETNDRTTTVTFAEAVYRNKPVEGTFALVQGYTPWGGALVGGGKRRVGTKGAGFVKVVHPDWTKPVKISVSAEDEGYAVNVSAFDAVTAELETLRTELETATGKDRANIGKKVKRREAKLATL